MHWLKLESHRVLTWYNFKLKVRLICGQLGDISVTMAAIVRPDGFSIFQCCHCFEWLLASCKRSSDAWCGLCSVYVLRFLEYNKTTCNCIKTYGGRYWTKQDQKTQNRNTKLETESQNPIQKHKTQNRITKPKTETQNSKQNHKTQNRNTKLERESQNPIQKHKTQNRITKPNSLPVPLSFSGLIERNGGGGGCVYILSRVPFLLCDFVSSFVFPFWVLFLFWVLWFCFEFCDSVLNFAILF